MSSRMSLRLGRMEQIWPTETTEVPEWLLGTIERAAASAEVIAVNRQAWVRGQRRRRAEGAPSPKEGEHPEVVHRELAELLALSRLTPDDPDRVLANWYEAAEGWPAMSAWPFSREQLAHDVEDHGWRQEQARTCPALEAYQAQLRAEIARREPVTNWCQWLVSGLSRTP